MLTWTEDSLAFVVNCLLARGDKKETMVSKKGQQNL